MSQLAKSGLLNVSARVSNTSLLRSFNTSAVVCKRMGKRIASVPEWKRKKLAEGPWWKPKEPLVAKAPISKTLHPQNKFLEMEQFLSEQVAAASACDTPMSDMADPYEKEPRTCILCPRRYSDRITPSYQNPKLLSQFVSPHTGKMYESHITGLCSYMQKVVEQEVAKSRQAGLMSTRVKNPSYLQDPVLFNTARPVKRNPY